ncbi:30S ribosomal protein THX [Winogradskyella sp.]|uniref:30S ribosomal protein THX n=1 Tax=Winogradskyella sp. TaxID=1883156 RepID=UPI00262FE873|nr:30S ribosomal protein THX [Winogradskyella sp.]
MGKGDKKTKKGKRTKKSYGKTRLRTRKTNGLISPKNFRKWSRERLYFEVGQFDFTVTIIFKQNTNSYLKYGKMITGLLYYTKKERRSLKIKLNSGVKYETDGKVLFTTLLKDKLSEQQVKLLFTEGFDNIDIFDISYYAYKHNPTYFNKKKKKLNEPIAIRISNDLDELSALKMLYNLFKRRIDSADYLIDFEKLKMSAIQKVLSIDETDSKYIHSEIVERRKVEFNFLVEDISFDIGETKNYSDQVLKDKFEFAKRIVEHEFVKAGIDPKKPSELKEHLRLYAGLIQIGVRYEDEIVLYGTKPKVVLDFKGFMHVVFRHCKVCNIGQNNVAKSRMPYELSDIKDLINSCLHLLEDDINSHFVKHPDKRFSRFGDRLIRFNGDYYEIHINTNGIIETFYNHER